MERPKPPPARIELQGGQLCPFEWGLLTLNPKYFSGTVADPPQPTICERFWRWLKGKFRRG